jgi:CheY-like chemotaxis protein
VIISVHSDLWFPHTRVEFTQRKQVGEKLLISFSKLLEDLCDLSPVSAICVPERLDSSPFAYALLEIVQHIRLCENQNIAKCPIYVESEGTGWIKILGDLSTGVEPLTRDTNLTAESIVQELSDHELHKIRELLVRLPAPGDNHHDRSNEWGPYRLLKSIDYANKFGETIAALEANLQNHPFWRMKVLRSNLLAAEEEDGEKQQNIKRYLNRIKHLQPRVAIVEDELDKGWREAYSAVFEGCDVTFFSSEKDISINNLDQSFDLMLIDLRLHKSDKSKADSSDKKYVAELSGNRLLNKIREHRNVLPIIMATASNKAWSYESSLDFGATGYWGKESPELSVASTYSLENTIDLLSTIVSALEWYNKVEKVVDGLNRIRDSISNDAIQVSVEQKLNTVIGQLHRRQSQYIRHYYGDSGMQSAFLAIWSINNDIKDYFQHEEVNSESREKIYSAHINNKTYPYCSKIGKKGKFYYSVEALEALNKPYKLKQKQFKDSGSDYFNEPGFIEFLLSVTGHNAARGNFHKIKNLRNSLAWTHGHTVADDESKIVQDCDWKHIQTALDLWYRIFSNKSFFEEYNLPIPDLD